MSIKYVEETLDNENELLRAMVAFVRCYPKDHFTGSGRFIAESWARFLTQRSDTNKNVAGSGIKPAVSIETDMKAEHAQLEDYIKASHPEPVYSEEWCAFLKCEQEILEHLLAKLKKP